jgi:hypothetical protein
MGEPWEINRLGSMAGVLRVKMNHLQPGIDLNPI